MITDFKQFGLEHIISLIIPCLLGLIFIFYSLKAQSEKAGNSLRIALAVVIVSIRTVRYFMDIYYGRFDLFDLLSVHICHIDLVLLVICFIKPRTALFNFVFIVGIPMGLAVALFPGTNHPVPGVSRAMFFIMSHMMLVVGAVYLAIVEKMKASFRYFIGFIVAGNVAIIIVYIINKVLDTNFLYIMSAPEGTVIKLFDSIFGWPGYVVVMDIIAIMLMLMMFLISKLVYRLRWN